MSGEDDHYWERLGAVWRAQESAPIAMALPLKRRLRWQTIVWRILFSIDALSGLFGLAVGVTMVVRSSGDDRWFGIAVVAAFLSLMMTTLWAWVGPRKSDLQSAVGMVDVAISQARRQLRVAKSWYIGCIVSLLLLAILAMLFSSQGRWIRDLMWELVIGLAVTVVWSVGAYFLKRNAQLRLDGFSLLKETFDRQ